MGDEVCGFRLFPLAGVLGLVLSLLVWGPLSPGSRRVRIRGYHDEAPPVIVEESCVYQDQPPT